MKKIPAFLYKVLACFILTSAVGTANGQQPVISSVSPLSGYQGSSVTITGSNFDATPASNIVYFGATRATITAASAGALTATVPPGASYRSLSVFNATTGMMGNSLLPFLPSFDNSLYTAGTVNFDPKVDIAANLNPIFVAVGDLDGDGKPDMIVANNSTSSNNISVYRNISTAGTLNATSFAAKVDISTGAAPNGIAIGDVDGDGIPDVVVCNQNANTVSVLRNTSSTGSITFATKVDFSINAPYSVAISDLDGDGKADIVAVNEANNKAGVFRNTSTPGTVSLAARIDLSTSTNPYAVTIGDVDGDGLPDIVCANFNAASVSVIRNTSTVGTISFAAKSDFATGSGTLPNCVSLVDIDGDGKLDMVAPDGGGLLVYVFRNTSTSGSVSFATKVSFSAGLDPSWISVGDMDGDGKPDLAMTNQSGGTNTISILRNTSTAGSITTGSFASVVAFATGVYPHGMVTSDLDGDGMPDMVATNYSAGTISLLRNHPLLSTPVTGTLTVCQGSTTTLSNATTGGIWTSSNTVVATLGSTTGVVSGVTGGTATVSYNASGGVATKVVTVNPLPVPGVIFGSSIVCPTQTIALTDPGGTAGGAWTSSATSIATIGTSGTVTGVAAGTTTISYTVTNGCATLSATRVVSVNPFPAAGVITGAATLDCSNPSVTLSDTASGGVWGSSAATIAAVGSSTGIVNYVNAGTATISYSVTAGGCTSFTTTVVTVSAGTAITSVSPMSGSPASSVTISGSGFSATPSSNIVVFGATAATVSSASSTSLSVTVPIGATYMPVSVENIACHHTAFSQYPYLPTFDNSAYASGSINFDAKVDFTCGSSPRAVAIKDVDGDGKPDLIVCNVPGNTVSVLRNTSTSGVINSGSFAAKVDFATGGGPYSAAVMDVDGDGKPEIVVSNQSSNTISVLRNTSSVGTITTGSFAAKVDFATTAQPYTIAIADIDGDGWPDIAVCNGTAATISVFRNNGISGSITTASFAAKVDFTTGSSPGGIAIGDLDGDNKPDIAVCNSSSNSISIFRNTSTPGSITSGWLASKVDFSTGSSPQRVVIGDLDGDGKPDLAAVNFSSSSLSLFRNTSTLGTISGSSFAARVDFTVGTNPYDVVLSDFNGDGKPDIAVTNSSSNTVSLFRNIISSAGTFSSSSLATRIDFTSSSSTYSLAAGDLDGDGKADLAVATTSGATILRNDPFLSTTITGTFVVCQTATTTLSNATTGGQWSTLNTSIATVGAATGVVTGIGTGTTTVSYTAAGGVATQVVTVTPLPNPGTITGTFSGCVGTTTTLTDAAGGGTWSSTVTSVATIGTSGVVTGVAAGTTVISYTATNSCGTAADTKTVTINTFPSAGSISGAAVVDCNNSTTTLSATVSGGVWSSSATGVATIGASGGDLHYGAPGTATISYAVTTGACTSYTTTVAVMSKPAISTVSPLAGYAGSSVTITGVALNSLAAGNIVYFGSTQATVTAASTTSLTVTVPSEAADQYITVNNLNCNQQGYSPFPFLPTYDNSAFSTSNFAAKIDLSPGSFAYGVALGDFDGDGKADLVAATALSNKVTVYLNTGTAGSVSFASGADFSTSANNRHVKVGDIDGDGKLDIIAACWGGAVTVLRNTSTAPGSVSFSRGDFSGATAATDVGIGDMDGDGKPDIVITYVPSTGLNPIISVLRNTGSAGSLSFATAVTFSAAGSGGGGGDPWRVAIGDIDGDGKPDLAITSNYNTFISVLRNTSSPGTLSFATEVDFSTGGSSSVGIVLADLDGDGKLDMAVTSGGVSVYRNTSSPGTISFSGAVSFGVNAYSIAAGDIDGDGKPDLITSNSYSGGMSVLHNSSSTGSITTGSFSVVDYAGVGTGYDVAVGDLTGDGKPDVAIANGSANSVSVFRNMPQLVNGITGIATLCPGTNITLSDATSGGTWTSTNTAVATIGTSSGIVYGVASGGTTISYFALGGYTASSITVSPLPDAGTISGTGSACPGGTTTFTDGTSGGVWSSSNTSVATLGTSGVVSAVAAGTSLISYSITNSCGTAVATKVFTVNPFPGTGSITGTFSVCPAATTTLSDAAGGGVWTSTTTSVASIGTSSGVVTGVAAGTATISYTVTSLGCTAAATTVMTVTPLPAAGSITGTATVCPTATTTLSDAAGGGAWSSAATGVATIDAGGIVTGVSAGTATISYSVSNGCGSAATTKVVTVTALPGAGTIAGTLNVCAAGTTILSDAAGGGVWSSAATSIATVGTTNGVVTGVAAGTTVISYSVTNTCATAVATATILVNPSAAPISGGAIVCPGNTISLSDATSAGAWSSSNTAVATITSGGVVTGVGAGNTVIAYTMSGGCAALTLVTVGNPSLSSIAGNGSSGYSGDNAAATGAKLNNPTGVAVDAAGNIYIADNTNNVIRKVNTSGVITTFAGTGTGGWTGDGFAATAATLRTINNVRVDAAGNVYAVQQGDNVIRKINTSGIISTVAGNGSTGSGGDGTPATNAALSTPTSVAIDPAGNLYIVDPGNQRIRKVNTAGIITTIAGIGTPGYSGDGSPATAAQLHNPDDIVIDAAGNLFITDLFNNVIRKINTAGIISTYAGTGSAGSGGDGTPATGAQFNAPYGMAFDAAGNLYISEFTGQRIRLINNNGIISTMAGTGSLGFSGDGNPATSGQFHSPAFIATDASGNLYVADEANQRIRKVAPVNAAVAAITGTTTLCSGATATLSNATTGGTWSSSTTSVATITSGGAVTAVSAGTTTITYSVAFTCGTLIATQAVTVVALPSAITGSSTVCASSSVTLADPSGTGTWLSSNTGVASVGSGTGTVSGVAAGTSVITFTLTATGCSITRVQTVNALPSAISGSSSVCLGLTTALTDPAGTGTWLSDNTAVATIGSSTGTLGGVTAGTATITFTLTSTSCAITRVQTVNALPAAIGGATSVCELAATTLTDASGTGSWVSSNTGVATIGPGTGTMGGVAAGTTTITFTLTATGCTITGTETVNPLPVAGSISGTLTVCPASTVTLTDAAGGGVWSSVTTSVATVDVSGIVTGVATGTTTISYTVINGCGTAAATKVVTVSLLPGAGAITGTATVCPAATTTLSDAAGGGVWSSVTTAVATVGATGVVTGVLAGTTTISYTVTNSCGTAAATTVVTVNPLPAAGSVTGTATVCPSATTTLSDAAGGGVWSSVTASVATVGVTGIVTGVTAGTTTISYTVTNSCGTAVATKIVTVSPLPAAGSITGTATVCPTATTTLSDAAGGGVWSSVTAAVGTIGATGIVTGVSAGTTTISYTVTNSCGTAVATAVVTVSPLPNAGSITGTAVVCPAATTTLSDAAGSGVWSSVTTAVATIGVTGIVTGVTAGTTIISYTVTNSCGTAAATIVATVSPLPNAGSITGTAVVCPTATTTLSDAAGSGVWSSVTTAVATVGATGIVTGVIAGTTIISYTVTNSCGTAAATTVATVSPLPNAGSITGTAVVCPTATTTLSDAAGGGVWSSVTTAVGTVGATGIVTGVSAGTTTISYTVTNSCGTAVATTVVTVSPLPNAGSITGTAVVCPTATTTLSDAAGGGVWSSVTTAVATIGGTGIVTGVTTGTTVISYTVTNSCGTAAATRIVTVSLVPNAGSITGTAVVCPAATTTLSDAAGGGVWSSVATAVGTIGVTGILTGVITGTTTISYTVTNSCGTAVATTVATVSPLPNAGSIAGTAVVCPTATTTLSDAAGGGVWSSVTTAVATIGVTGIVTGVTAGTTIISYTVTNSCGTAVATTVATVSPLPNAGSITGTAVVCPTATTTLSDAAGGGVWSSVTTAVGTIGVTGIVTGVTAGTTTISYTVTNSCGTAVATTVATVSPLPNAGSITGTAIVCPTATTTLSDAAGGGVWSSVTSAVGTVGATGIVTGVSAGTTTISYTVTNSCGTAVATRIATVSPLPNAGGITGTATVCPTATTTLSDAAGGGVWSSVTTAVASIGLTGIVTGVATGTTIISYTVTNSCGTAVATTVVTVSPLPGAGSITGTAIVCPTAITTLSDAAGGGIWNSVTTAVATVSGTGVVTGVAAGTTTISYSVTNSCGTAVATIVATVSPLPNAGVIAGIATVCPGATTALSDAAGGGVWSSVTTGVGTIDATGLVMGVSAGTTIISYTVSNSCGTAAATRIATVSPLPNAGSITGTAILCPVTTTALADAAGGGIWSSVTTAVGTIGATGIVTGVSAGTTTISYTVTNSCGTAAATVAVTVSPLPNAGGIAGAAIVCPAVTTSLSDAAGGGVWGSVTAAVATVDAAGTVTGVTAGTTIISYTVTNSCGTAAATRVATVSPLPNAGGITGTTVVCATVATTLIDAAGGGVWSSVSTAIASVGVTGIVTGVSAGTTLISYTVTNSCGTAAATTVITVNPLPNAGSIAGAAAVCPATAILLTDAFAGGVWSSAATAVATVDGLGVVTGVSAGTATISYAVTNSCGTAVATTVVPVSPLPGAGSITGTVPVCPGGTISLADAVAGGVWTSVTTAVGTVNGTGSVTGVSAGNTIISYTVTNSCGTATAITVVTVSPLPDAGSITGSAAICPATAAALSDAASGGVWTSVTTAVATVNTSGVVAGVSAGTTVISYTVTNSCGTAVATAVATVNPLPVAGSITGTASVCPAFTTTLANAAGGGVWHSASTGIATVSASGIVTGVGAGNAAISYSVTNSCGTAVTTYTVTVTGLGYPMAGSISGASLVCAGAYTILSDTATTGGWSTSNGNASVSAAGLLTGIVPGTDTVLYTVVNACGTSTAAKVVTVGLFLTAGTISGPSSVCTGSSIALSDLPGGGAWSSSNGSASISSAGIVTGAINGLDTIYYTVSSGCGAVVATHLVNVISIPIGGTVSGAATLCAGMASTYTTTATGGLWSASNTNAAINSAGLLTALTAGTDTVLYIATNTCGSARSVFPMVIGAGITAGAISGAATVCEGSAITLADAATGGVWSASNSSASVAGGVVTAMIAGIDTISYTVSSSCGSVSATHIVTVNPLPDPGAISGPATVCTGATITLADAAPGGFWTSGNARATVTGGIVTGMLAGSVVISYTNINSCGTAVATTTITVGAAPVAGIISGPGNVCVGATIAFSDAVTGGVWTVSNSSAAITGGVATGMATGIDTVYYTVTNSCGVSTVSATVSVDPLPVAGSISGSTAVCAGSSALLTATVAGGAWSVTNAHATIASTGSLTGVTGGLDTVVYAVANSCGTATATAVVTINALPLAGVISGPSVVCAGASIVLTDPVPGGVWSASNASAAVIGGIVGGTSAGVDTIAYTVTTACGAAAALAIITVNPRPNAGTITGAGSVCSGATIALGDAVAGGAWSSAAPSAASVSATGVVTGGAAGTTTISYAVTNSCGTATALKTVNVNALPDAGVITGASNVCSGSSITLASTVAGGAWSSSNTHASVTGGIVTGVSAGIDTISYSVSNACGMSASGKTLTVNPLPNAGTIIGAGTVCAGATTTLTASVAGGTWSAGNARATISALGIVTGLVPGLDTVSYMFTNACGSAVALKVVTINATPSAGSITGISELCIGAAATLTDPATGGVWSSSNAAIASVTATGSVMAIAAGTATISYAVNSACGAAVATHPIVVLPLTDCNTLVHGVTNQNDELKVYPNPNEGLFAIKLLSDSRMAVHVTITNLVGQQTNEYNTETNTELMIHLNQPAGTYFISATTAYGRWVTKFTIR